jgi:adenine-specific DNA-methyltransferase
MASLAEREALRGKVQCIYFDPPYGIKFNSNWQVSTLSTKVDDNKRADITREPEQVKAFRDTWKDGIHSYLTYLRDRLTVARDLLTESGSIFLQISDENVHRVRSLMDEVFGEENFCGQISFTKTSGQTSQLLATGVDFIIWFAKDRQALKFRKLFIERPAIDKVDERYVCVEEDISRITDLSVKQKSGLEDIPAGRILKLENLTSQTGSENSRFTFSYSGREFRPGGSRGWSTHRAGMLRTAKAGYLWVQGNTLWWKSYRDEGRVTPRTAEWNDTRSNAFGEERIYVVQTNVSAIRHCILMTTDPGDLVLDPTCGSGTTAYVAEQWGRRWITTDTSRVALALARQRLMSGRFPYYLLADSPEGRDKEQEVSGRIQPDTPTTGEIAQGFVYERAPHITLKSIANNEEIDTIWERWQLTLEPLREKLLAALGTAWEEWEIPREVNDVWPEDARRLHAEWWKARVARQKEIDTSIAQRADDEYLYDRPYVDKSKVRVTGPFTVESLSPHRAVAADEDRLGEELTAHDGARRRPGETTPETEFSAVVIEHLKTFGVNQSEKRDTIRFTSIEGWPGHYIGAQATFTEKNGRDIERRAAILIGPEYGTLTLMDLQAAASEATQNRFDLLIACAFAFDAHAAEFTRAGPLSVLQARMNPELHLAGDLKNTGKGNMFVVFGEPDIDILPAEDDQIAIKINGVDVFDPNSGDIRSDDTESIAAWFIDTDYNEESFFVRHAYFLGAGDPYKSLKKDLKAEIDADAWATLYRDTSRPFPRPREGRIAVKVINHFGDEVMKVFRV